MGAECYLHFYLAPAIFPTVLKRSKMPVLVAYFSKLIAGAKAPIAPVLNTPIHICNLWTGQFISYKSVI